MSLIVDSVQTDAYKNKAGTREYGRCTAWVNFNGTGTVAIRDSLNVSSVTDNGTGDYTVNFAQAMANTNYSDSNTVRGSSSVAIDFNMFIVGAKGTSLVNAKTTTSARYMVSVQNTPSAFDAEEISVQIFGGDA